MPTKPALSKLAIVLTGLLLTTTSVTTLAASKATIKKGKQLYNQNCLVCHQANGVGKVGFAPSLTNPELLSIASDKFFESTIKDGRPGTAMPPWVQLGKRKISDIVAYLRSFSKRFNISAHVNNEPKTKGDPDLGKVWFVEICSTCHGIDGNGYASGGSGTAIGFAGFQSKVSDGFIRETISHGRSNTQMRGFSGSEGLAHLTPQNIDDVIAYMRTLPAKNAAKSK